ncbi:MAG: MAPEG family protein [Nannocystaceae bacterium]|nr:MAPEG family protein [bacterium]
MSLLALLIYAGWTIALLLGIAALRVSISLTGQRAANGFAPAGDDVSPFSGRLCRAHANCYENLPVVAALILVAVCTDNGDVTDPAALVLVGARVGQSLVHLRSTSNRAVSVRFALFAVQLGIAGYWVLALGLRLL